MIQKADHQVYLGHRFTVVATMVDSIANLNCSICTQC